MSDGAVFVVVMSEEMVKELNLEPIARLVSYAAVGLGAKNYGSLPNLRHSKMLKQAGLSSRYWFN